MATDTATLIGTLQKEIQAIRDRALIAPLEQKASMLQVAKLIEESIREFDRHAV